MGMEGFFNKAKRGITTTVAATTLAMGAAHAEGGDGGKKKIDPEDGPKKVQAHLNSVEKNNTINFYTSSKTEAGSTTPTGLNNSFLNNQFGIKTGDVQKIAQEHGLRTDNETVFQEDLFSLLEQNHPDIIKYLLEKYGQTAAGTLKDGFLGVRTADAMSVLIKKEVKAPIPEVKQETPQPNTDYVINVRGDEPDGRGGYFFTKNLADLQEASKGINFSSKEEFEGGARAQMTVNMDLKVLLEQIKPETRKLMGPIYRRDPNDASKYIEVDEYTPSSNMDITGK